MEKGVVDFSGVKTFSATKARERDALGDMVTQWMREHPVIVTGAEVRQSSDEQFHCLSIILFYRPKSEEP